MMPPARFPGQDQRLHHCRRTRCALEIEILDSLSRTRALTLDESLQLEHAIRGQEDNDRKRRRAKRPNNRAQLSSDEARVGA